MGESVGIGKGKEWEGTIMERNDIEIKEVREENEKSEEIRLKRKKERRREGKEIRDGGEEKEMAGRE